MNHNGKEQIFGVVQEMSWAAWFSVEVSMIKELTTRLRQIWRQDYVAEI